MQWPTVYTSFGASYADEYSQGGASQSVNLEGLLIVRDHTAQHLAEFFCVLSHDVSQQDVQFDGGSCPTFVYFLSEFGHL